MSRREDDLEREIRTHLELEAEDGIADGLSAAEANRKARVAFGGVARTREAVRAVWVPRWIDELRLDLAYTMRSIIASPAFSAFTILTLALGMGANTAIFSLMDQVLLRSLPVPHPERIVTFEGPGVFQGLTVRDDAFSVPMFRALHAASADVLEGLAARFTIPVTVSANQQPERVIAEVVSGDYFGALGIGPVAGRTLGPADDRVVDGHPVVVLTHAYWVRRFGPSSSVVGTPIVVNGVVMTIVGVTPPGFAGFDLASPGDIFVPLMMKKHLTPTRDDLASWRARWVTLAGRLKPGVSVDTAAARLQTTYSQWLLEDVKTAHLDPGEYEPFISKSLVVRAGGRGLSSLRARFSTVLFVLMGMVGVVLLIACANVTNLLLARAASRQREAAIRLALGAGRMRVVRQRLVETLLLTTAGALIGIAVAWLTTRVLIDMLPFAGARVLSPEPDARVMLFTVGIAAFTALAAGLWPAWQYSAPALMASLKEETASVLGGGKAARMRKVIVVAQVGLSVILLAGAGLFARSLSSLRTVEAGMAIEDLLQFRIDLASTGYPVTRARVLVGQLEDQLQQIPGVVSASSASVPAFSGGRSRQTVRVEGYQHAPSEDMNPNVLTVGPGYFATMGVPLVAGREFTSSDPLPDRRVAVINETMARYFWQDEDALGRRFSRPTTGDDWHVIGIVRDTKFASMRDAPARTFYVPYMQADTLGSVVLYVRYRTGVDAVAAAAQRVVRSLGPGIPVYDMRTVERQLDQSLITERLLARLSLVFAGLATLLAAIGLYGLISLTVARRTREIGIRMALGAPRHHVVALVLGDVARLLGIGIAVGLPVAVGLAQLLRSQLFATSAADPASLTLAVGSLAAVGLLASYLPARRAARISPTTALRHE